MIYDKNHIINSLFNKNSLKVLLYFIKVKNFHIFKQIIYKIYYLFTIYYSFVSNLYLCLIVI